MLFRSLIPFVYAKVLNSVSFQCSQTPAVPVSQFQAIPDCVGFFFFFVTNGTQVNHVVKKNPLGSGLLLFFK